MRNPFKKKKQEEEIDAQAAQQMLSNVLDACNYEHNTVSLEVLSSYSNYRKERYSLQKALLIVMIVLFAMLPLLFISADVTAQSDERYGDARLTLTVSNIIPIQSVSATLNGKNIAVYEAGPRQYVVQPADNGTLQVNVTLINNQMTTLNYDVTEVDNDVPALEKTEAADGHLLLWFSDTGSGVDHSSLRATASDDETPVDIWWDEEKGCGVIDYPKTVTNVYVSDNAGNTVHLLLTPE